MVLCPSQLVERAVQQYLSERAALEAKLTASQDDDAPAISSRDDQLQGSSGATEEGENSSGAINGDTPAIEEGNGELVESPQPPRETSAGTEAAENEEEEDEREIEPTPEWPDSVNLPQYFSEVYTHHTKLTMRQPLS